MGLEHRSVGPLDEERRDGVVATYPEMIFAGCNHKHAVLSL
jgi:hypothetical protein